MGNDASNIRQLYVVLVSPNVSIASAIDEIQLNVVQEPEYIVGASLHQVDLSVGGNTTNPKSTIIDEILNNILKNPELKNTQLSDVVAKHFDLIDMPVSKHINNGRICVTVDVDVINERAIRLVDGGYKRVDIISVPQESTHNWCRVLSYDDIMLKVGEKRNTQHITTVVNDGDFEGGVMKNGVHGNAFIMPHSVPYRIIYTQTQCLTWGGILNQDAPMSIDTIYIQPNSIDICESVSCMNGDIIVTLK